MCRRYWRNGCPAVSWPCRTDRTRASVFCKEMHSLADLVEIEFQIESRAEPKLLDA